MRSIALLSPSGGTGKTLAALTIAEAWAEQGPCWLVDTDPKGAGSATDLLDRADPQPGEAFQWSKADRTTLLTVIGGATVPVVVDTAAGLGDALSIEVADAVSAVVVTGAIDQMRQIIQAIQTLQAGTETPVAALFTRSKSVTVGSALGEAVQSAVGALVPVLGVMRDLSELGRVVLGRTLPGRVTDQRVRGDAETVVGNLGRWLEKVEV